MNGHIKHFAKLLNESHRTGSNRARTAGFFCNGCVYVRYGLIGYEGSSRQEGWDQFRKYLQPILPPDSHLIPGYVHSVYVDEGYMNFRIAEEVMGEGYNIELPFSRVVVLC